VKVSEGGAQPPPRPRFPREGWHLESSAAAQPRKAGGGQAATAKAQRGPRSNGALDRASPFSPTAPAPGRPACCRPPQSFDALSRISRATSGDGGRGGQQAEQGAQHPRHARGRRAQAPQEEPLRRQVRLLLPGRPRRGGAPRRALPQRSSAAGARLGACTAARRSCCPADSSRTAAPPPHQSIGANAEPAAGGRAAAAQQQGSQGSDEDGDGGELRDAVESAAAQIHARVEVGWRAALRRRWNRAGRAAAAPPFELAITLLQRALQPAAPCSPCSASSCLTAGPAPRPLLLRSSSSR
jgi:hypothetical protein